MIADEERALLLLIQEAIPLVPRPYQALAEQLGTSEEHVLSLVRTLLDEGKIKRLAALPNHYALGITANAMTAWDVPDDEVDELGQSLGQQSEVTHCYCRPRHLPEWPYNLFAMVHGFDRGDVLATIDRISRDVGLAEMPRDVLFSRRMLKKKGTRIQPNEG